jgi:hypothetical protein
MRKFSMTDINFHDAQLLDFEFSQNEQRIKMLIASFLEKDQQPVSIRLDFQEISFLLLTNLQPWGTSPFINQALFVSQLPCNSWKLSKANKLLHIQMQSGDDIFIAYNTVDVSQNA